MQTDFNEVLEFLADLEDLEKDLRLPFIEKVLKDLMAELIRRVKLRTPVTENETILYKLPGGNTGTLEKVGGGLRRGWTGGIEMDDPRPFVDGLMIEHSANQFRITVVNTQEYAEFVEFGHRQNVGQFVPVIGPVDENGITQGAVLKKSWVEGQYPLTISIDELSQFAPEYIERELEKWLKKSIRGLT